MEIYNIISSLQEYSFAGETLYSMKDFQRIFLESPNYIEKDDVLLVPFYITQKSKILELYEYELNIEIVEEPNLETCTKGDRGKNTYRFYYLDSGKL